MTGVEDIDPKRENPADVLAAMVSGDEADFEHDSSRAEDSDPLATMAEGGDFEDREQEAEPCPDEGPEPAFELAGTDDAVYSARRTGAAARQRQAHSHAYMKVMAPFLVVVAALLLLVGGITTGIVLKKDPETPARTMEVLVMLVSFPLAAVLALGAWWFHRTTKGP